MVVSNNIQKNKYVNYINKDTKLARDVKEGKLIKIKKGLYETNPNTPAYYLANFIYGPSYISFDFALSFYGLIPERVEVVTCATFNKNKKKTYNTPFGTLIYRDVPERVFSLYVDLIEENGYTFHLATKEKALCDKLYILSPVKNIEQIKNLLLYDLRIDKEELEKLNMDIIKRLSEVYHSTNVSYLYKFLRRINE